jgi:hypothetical protein
VWILCAASRRELLQGCGNFYDNPVNCATSRRNLNRETSIVTGGLPSGENFDQAEGTSEVGVKVTIPVEQRKRLLGYGYPRPIWEHLHLLCG